MLAARDWTLVKSLFAAALDVPREERDGWLREHHQSVPASVVAEVQRLLEAAPESDSEREVPDANVVDSASGTLQPEGTLLLSRFEIRRLLGRGGMGEVYLATDRLLVGDVALKLVPRDRLADRAFVSRLEQEVRASRRIQHENVCKLYDLHRDPATGLTFLTMEFVNGITLAERLQMGGPLSLTEVDDLVSGLAAGLDAIHSAGIVHRDLKPGNIFLTPRVVVADFGLAYDSNNLITETISLFGPNAIVGTPSYMAPEQLLGQGAGIAADIHAFGSLVFEAFTGQKAFPGETPLAVALKRLSDDPLPVNPAIPAGWQRAIHACLARDAAKRPSKVADVILIARSPAEQLAFAPTPVARRRLTAAMLGALGVTATGSLGYLVWNGSRPKEPDPGAVQSYKLGLEYMRRTSNREILAAVEAFEKAVAVDGNYAEAWAQLADAYCVAANYAAMPGREAREKAERAARRAIALDAGLVLPHAALAYVLSTDVERWAAAKPEYEKALERSPKEAVIRSRFAAYLGRREEHDRAIEIAKSALALEPAQFRFLIQYAAELFRGRRFSEYLSQVQKTVDLHPTIPDGYLTLCRAYEWNGRLAEAEQALATGQRLFVDTDATAYRACLRQAQGHTREATRLADRYLDGWRQGKYETNTAVSVEAALRRTDSVFAVIEGGFQREDETVLAVPSNPYVSYLRQDPRMLVVRRKLRLGT